MSKKIIKVFKVEIGSTKVTAEDTGGVLCYEFQNGTAEYRLGWLMQNVLNYFRKDLKRKIIWVIPIKKEKMWWVVTEGKKKWRQRRQD